MFAKQAKVVGSCECNMITISLKSRLYSFTLAYITLTASSSGGNGNSNCGLIIFNGSYCTPNCLYNSITLGNKSLFTECKRILNIFLKSAGMSQSSDSSKHILAANLFFLHFVNLFLTDFVEARHTLL